MTPTFTAPRRLASRVARAALLVLGAAFANACATTGATLNSGVGDAYIEHPPWYAGASTASVRADTTRIGHLPVVYQRGASQAPIFDPRDGAGTPVGDLLAEMTAYLDSLGAAGRVSVRLVEGGRVSAVAHEETRQPPDVRFGCDAPPGDDCPERGADSALGRAGQRMKLAVGRPSPEWIAWMQDVGRDVGTGRTLVVTLEVGQYLPRQRGVVGRKEVEMGTGYTANLPWLTSLETPVTVLQLTGALVGRDGKAIRIGAEGFMARRTPLVISAVRGQAILTEEDVRQARTLRRDDLPGQPLAWRVALRNLVAGLTGWVE